MHDSHKIVFRNLLNPLVSAKEDAINDILVHTLSRVKRKGGSRNQVKVRYVGSLDFQWVK